MNEQNYQIRPQSLGIDLSVIIPKSFKKPLINPISWAMFEEMIDPPLLYSAHVYWRIQYFINQINQKPLVTCKIIIQKKSWVKQGKKSYQLLKHQYGHYLVGCLCAHQFLRKVNRKKKRQQLTYQNYCQFVHTTFKKNLQKYLQMEIQYDNQTDHMFNSEMQVEWEKKLIEKLNQFSTLKPVINQENNFKKQQRQISNSKSKLPMIRRSINLQRKSIKSQGKIQQNRSNSKEKSFRY